MRSECVCRHIRTPHVSQELAMQRYARAVVYNNYIVYLSIYVISQIIKKLKALKGVQLTKSTDTIKIYDLCCSPMNS